MRLPGGLALALLLVLAVLCGSACAQPVVNVYSSMAEKDLRRLAAEFESRHGIKVNLWRSGKNRILQRVLSEARAGRHEVDVIHNPAPEMEALHREKLLQPMRSPRSEEHTSELQSLAYLVCRLLLEKKKKSVTGHIDG